MVTDLNERALVGSLLLSPAPRVRKVRALFDPSDLADARLQSVIELIDACVRDQVSPDIAAVFAKAMSSGTVPAASLPALGKLLTELAAEVPTPASADYYATSVVEGSVRRRVRQAAQRLKQVANDSPLEDMTKVVLAEAGAIQQSVARLDKWVPNVQ